jgi:hypothetical protein
VVLLAVVADVAATGVVTPLGINTIIVAAIVTRVAVVITKALFFLLLLK